MSEIIKSISEHFVDYLLKQRARSSRLIPKIITDKIGRRRKVWVKPPEEPKVKEKKELKPEQKKVMATQYKNLYEETKKLKDNIQEGSLSDKQLDQAIERHSKNLDKLFDMKQKYSGVHTMAHRMRVKEGTYIPKKKEESIRA